jgi:hypothetical protein
MEVKKRRKLQDKEVKRAKALAAGRDIEEEQRLERERAESGEGHRRREEVKENRCCRNVVYKCVYFLMVFVILLYYDVSDVA